MSHRQDFARYGWTVNTKAQLAAPAPASAPNPRVHESYCHTTDASIDVDQQRRILRDRLGSAGVMTTAGTIVDFDEHWPTSIDDRAEQSSSPCDGRRGRVDDSCGRLHKALRDRGRVAFRE